MDYCVWRHDAVGRRICLYDFELNSSHASPNDERISLVDWTVGLQEVWLKVHLKQITVIEKTLLPRVP